MSRSALFWDIIQRIGAIHYKRFGTTYRAQEIQDDFDILTLEDETDRLCRNIRNELLL